MATWNITLTYFSHGDSPEEALQNLFSDLHQKGPRVDAGVTFKKITVEDELIRVSETSC